MLRELVLRWLPWAVLALIVVVLFLNRRRLGLMVELRAEARKRKDFAVADRIRDGLVKMGVTLEDRKDGTVWHIP